MAFVYKDRVRVACVPSGLGDVIVGAAPVGYLTFATAGFVDADTTIICIIDPTAGEFLVCHATYNAATPSVTRGTVIINHLGTTANVNFTGGNAGVIFVGLDADQVIHKQLTAAQLFTAGVQPVPSSGTLTATGTVQGDAATIVSRRTFITSGGANTGVVLRTAASDPVNTEVLVFNKTASAKILYPDSGANFDNAAADVGISLGANTGTWMKRTGALQWYTY